MAAKYSAASAISSSVMARARSAIVLVFGLRGSALRRSPLRKSRSCWTKYAGGSADTGAFSGRPRPFGRWQKPQPRRPVAVFDGPSRMMSVIGGWSSGCQSMTFPPSRMSTSENDAELPGACLGRVCSVASSLGRRLRVGAACGVALSPGFGGSTTPYAHNGRRAKSTVGTEVSTLSAGATATHWSVQSPCRAGRSVHRSRGEHTAQEHYCANVACLLVSDTDNVDALRGEQDSASVTRAQGPDCPPRGTAHTRVERRR
jgi:hypothetical protein